MVVLYLSIKDILSWLSQLCVGAGHETDIAPGIFGCTRCTFLCYFPLFLGSYKSFFVVLFRSPFLIQAVMFHNGEPACVVIWEYSQQNLRTLPLVCWKYNQAKASLYFRPDIWLLFGNNWQSRNLSYVLCPQLRPIAHAASPAQACRSQVRPTPTSGIDYEPAVISSDL